MSRGLTDWVFGRMGFVIMRKEQWRTERGVLGWENLGSIGFAPATVIDVGVGRGTPALYAAFPDSYLVLVDPLQKEFQPYIDKILTRRKGEYHPVALGEKQEERIINVEPRRRLWSSILERTENAASGDTPERRQIRMVTLDSLLAGARLPAPYGLKLDVEGFELPALRGASVTLGKVEFVIVETSVGRRFVGGSTLASVVGFMSECGFALQDIVQISRTPDLSAIAHADLLFSRAP